MEYYIIPDEEALSKCTWCRKHITDDMEVFGAGAKLKPGIDLKDYNLNKYYFQFTELDRLLNRRIKLLRFTSFFISKTLWR